MNEEYISEITRILNTLDEDQLMYILTFIEKMFVVPCCAPDPL